MHKLKRPYKVNKIDEKFVFVYLLKSKKKSQESYAHTWSPSFGNEGFLFHLANANYDSRPAAATSSHLPDPHFGCSGTQISEAKTPKSGGQKPRFSGSGGGSKRAQKGEG